jgi:hypothetical protein
VQATNYITHTTDYITHYHTCIREHTIAMKFRARLSKENLLSLHGVAATLTKINATAVVFLTEDRVRFAAIQENIDAPRIFAEIDALGMFHEYRVQSQTSNTILFELNMEQLTKSLYSGRNSATCQLKLVKRDDKPCLCFESKANEGECTIYLSISTSIYIYIYIYMYLYKIDVAVLTDHTSSMHKHIPCVP